MPNNLLINVALLFITTLVLGLMLGYLLGYEHGAPDEISSFEECVAAGNPVMESYPEQCRTPDGKHFVRKIEEVPQEPVYCTMDAKICPDGTAVGRIPPSCEFAPCP